MHDLYPFAPAETDRFIPISRGSQWLRVLMINNRRQLAIKSINNLSYFIPGSIVRNNDFKIFKRLNRRLNSITFLQNRIFYMQEYRWI